MPKNFLLFDLFLQAFEIGKINYWVFKIKSSHNILPFFIQYLASNDEHTLVYFKVSIVFDV